MNNLGCTKNIRGSNLKLLAAYKARIHRMEGVYQTPCPRASLLEGCMFLRSNGKQTFAKVTRTLHYRPNVGTTRKCQDKRRLQLGFYFFRFY
jgi:hypothetical protein